MCVCVVGRHGSRTVMQGNITRAENSLEDDATLMMMMMMMIRRERKNGFAYENILEDAAPR